MLLPIPPMPPSAREILFWSSAICCLLAQVLIVRSVLATKTLPDTGPALPRSRGGVELLWALLPAAALGVLLFFTWREIRQRTTLERHSSSVPTMEAVR